MPNKEVVLTQLSSSHRNVRTKTIEGRCVFLPRIGHRFNMTAPPLALLFGRRWFSSSPVQHIKEKNGAIFFRTKNSNYKLEVKEET